MPCRPPELRHTDPVVVDGRFPDDVPEIGGGEVLLPTHAPPYGLDLRPWESRIHRVG